MTTYEYRVVSKRADMKQKARNYRTLKGARRRMTLLGSDPWTAYGRNPDEFFCCDGRECGCMGITVREESDARRESMPKLEWARIERREVLPWAEFRETQGRA